MATLTNQQKRSATSSNAPVHPASVVNAIQSGFSFLLKEDGFHLLIENSARIIIDLSTSLLTNQPKH